MSEALTTAGLPQHSNQEHLDTSGKYVDRGTAIFNFGKIDVVQTGEGSVRLIYGCFVLMSRTNRATTIN